MAIQLFQYKDPSLADVTYSCFAVDVSLLIQRHQLVAAVDSSRESVHRGVGEVCDLIEELHHRLVVDQDVIVHLAGRQHDGAIVDSGESGYIRRGVHAPWGSHVAVACLEVGKLCVEVGFEVRPQAILNATIFDLVVLVLESLFNVLRHKHSEERKKVQINIRIHHSVYKFKTFRIDWQS